MGRVHEDFKRELYSIPALTVGGSTRPDTGSFGSTGNAMYVVAGATDITLTVTGTRYGSTAFVQETFNTTIASTGIKSEYTDWTSVFGVTLTDIYGKNMSTQDIDVTVYADTTAASTNEVVNLTSGEKSKKAAIFRLSGSHNVTIHDITGNLYVGDSVYPTSNNAFKMTAAMAVDHRIGNTYLILESDTGGATAQVKVWAD